jgi:hypothetical protein
VVFGAVKHINEWKIFATSHHNSFSFLFFLFFFFHVRICPLWTSLSLSLARVFCKRTQKKAERLFPEKWSQLVLLLFFISSHIHDCHCPNNTSLSIFRRIHLRSGVFCLFFIFEISKLIFLQKGFVCVCVWEPSSFREYYNNFLPLSSHSLSVVFFLLMNKFMFSRLKKRTHVCY